MLILTLGADLTLRFGKEWYQKSLVGKFIINKLPDSSFSLTGDGGVAEDFFAEAPRAS